jgi:hypothetical protein
MASAPAAPDHPPRKTPTRFDIELRNVPPPVDFAERYGLPILRMDDRGRDLAKLHMAEGANDTREVERGRVQFWLEGRGKP